MLFRSQVSSASIAATLKAGLDANDAVVGNSNGDARAAIAAAPRKLEAVYSYPFQNHAPMETMNATAKITPAAGGAPERCEVWAPTQNGEAAFAATVEASGLPAALCEVYKMTLGGGFGRRGMTDYVRQAVVIAKEMPGTPVKLILNQNTIYLESFIDEIAFATKQDPLALRRKLMASHPKHLAVLNGRRRARRLGQACA